MWNVLDEAQRAASREQPPSEDAIDDGDDVPALALTTTPAHVALNGAALRFRGVHAKHDEGAPSSAPSIILESRVSASTQGEHTPLLQRGAMVGQFESSRHATHLPLAQ